MTALIQSEPVLSVTTRAFRARRFLAGRAVDAEQVDLELDPEQHDRVIGDELGNDDRRGN